MKNEWNINFFSKYKICSTSNETDATLTKTEMKNLRHAANEDMDSYR